MAATPMHHPTPLSPTAPERQDLPPAVGKRFSGIAADVQALYEAYPYPQYRQVTVCPDAARQLAYLANRCASSVVRHPRRILVAGCGTTHAVGSAAANPSATVLGIDLSARALEIARRMAQDLRVTNLSLRQADLLRLSEREGPFDLIECYGVLHHTANPLRGLRALARVLAPGGLLSLMVYSQRVRAEIGDLQRVYRLLNQVREAQGGGDSLPDRMRFADRLFRGLAASDGRLASMGRRAAALLQEDPTQFADTYLQPQEIRYALPEVLALVRDASLEAVSFASEREWDPAAYLDDPRLLDQAARLPAPARWRLCDALGSPFYHLLCAHPGSSGPPDPRPCATDDTLLLDIVPRPCAVHSHPLTGNRVSGAPAPEPREGWTYVRRGSRLRFRGTLGELEAPPIVLDYLRLADGRRTLREIAEAAAHLAAVTPPPPAEAAAAFRALLGATPFLTPDATRCRRCPRRPRQDAHSTPDRERRHAD